MSFLQVDNVKLDDNFSYICDKCKRLLNYKHEERYIEFIEWQKRLCANCAVEVCEHFTKLVDKIYG